MDEDVIIIIMNISIIRETLWILQHLSKNRLSLEWVGVKFPPKLKDMLCAVIDHTITGWRATS